MKNWIVSKAAKKEYLHDMANISDIIVDLLVSRGIDTPEKIEKFMNPKLSDLHDPFLLKDMDKAVDRIILAIAQQEKILIYGDYDVDGVTSSSILYIFLKKLGVNVEVFIPSRFEEGYGLSLAAINKFKDTKYDLIITVDCGIASIQEVDIIKNLGTDIIITDHHQCQDELPTATAVINPHRADCSYPFKELCGAGVAFKLVQALSSTLKIKGAASEFIDIVALGTVADIVNLTDENRIIVYYGLQKMNRNPGIGVKALIEVAGLQSKSITSYSIAFGLAPRLNAAGRLGDAKRGIKLLTAESEQEAKELAKELNSENMLRQQTEGEIYNQVIQYIETQHDFSKNKVIVACGENWHHGVIGIVASKVVEKYYRPCIILSKEDDVYRGSGRSIEGFNIFEALTCCSGYLEKYGGHEMAAGLSIDESHLREFREQINNYANENLISGDLVEKIYIDAELKSEEANLSIANEIKNMAPFGAGNPSPVFVCNNFKISSIRVIGDGKHLKLSFMSGEKLLDAIAFNMGELCNVYSAGDIVDIVCSLDVNSFNNRENVQLIIRDIRFCEDISIKNGFLSTINNTILFKNLEKADEIVDKHVLVIDLKALYKILEEANKKGEKSFFLINDIDELTELYSVFKVIEKPPVYRTSVGEYLEERDADIYIILNPTLDTAKTIKNGNNIFVAGRWLDRLYLNALVNSIDNERLFLYNNKLGVSIFDGTGFERADITAVYKYIWSMPDKVITLKDIDNAITDINKQYNRVLKQFSFIKCIEVLDEVQLINAEFEKYKGIKIEKFDNRGKKVQLEESIIYRKNLAMLN